MRDPDDPTYGGPGSSTPGEFANRIIGAHPMFDLDGDGIVTGNEMQLIIEGGPPTAPSALGELLLGGIPGLLRSPSMVLPGTAQKCASKTTQVTSWADKGITPDLNPGRWVMKGGPTKWNFWKSGLPGPKVFPQSKFPFFKYQKSKADFSNFISKEVPASSLKLPPGLEIIKAPIGQRVIKDIK